MTTQLSIDGASDWTVGDPVPLSMQLGTNADVIASIAHLYLTGTVLDVTYGRGLFWERYAPAHLTHHDIDQDGVDFRDLPHPEASFDTVVFDPPYIPQSGSLVSDTGIDTFRDRYGLTEQRSHMQLLELMTAGLTECCRVSSEFVLVKCMDYTANRKLQLMHVSMIELAQSLGMIVHDLIVHATGSGPGAASKTRARRAHSYLIVLRHDKRRRRHLRAAT